VWVRAGFVNDKNGCTRLAAASDKVYQLLAHGCRSDCESKEQMSIIYLITLTAMYTAIWVRGYGV
jgi:hypothetical protein